MKTIEQQIIEKYQELVDIYHSLIKKCEGHIISCGEHNHLLHIEEATDILNELTAQLKEQEEVVYSANDIDLAYCTGVFNTGGVDVLSNELERLKRINVKPRQIFEQLKDKVKSHHP